TFAGILTGAVQAWAAPDVDALPTGFNLVAGTVGVGTSGTTMTVSQSTQRAVVSWQTFDIGQNATVNFAQPDTNSMVLNRVVGPQVTPTEIFGKLSATGRVIVQDKNGVIFGNTA